MATGTVPFTGTSAAIIFDALLNRVPTPPVRLNQSVPASLESIIEKALEKDRDDRYQSAKEMLVDLRRVKREVDSGRSSVAGEARSATLSGGWWRSRSALVVVAVASLMTIAGAILYYRPRTSTSEPPLPAMRTAPFTSLAGRETSPTFSPDGSQVAFIWSDDKGHQDLVRQADRQRTPLRLTASPGVERLAAWSPDGRYIAFVRVSGAASGLFIIPALGGAERLIVKPTWGTTGMSMGSAGRRRSPIGAHATTPPVCSWRLSTARCVVSSPLHSRRQLAIWARLSRRTARLWRSSAMQAAGSAMSILSPSPAASRAG